MKNEEKKKRIDVMRAVQTGFLFLICAMAVIGFGGVVITDDLITMGDANMTGGNLLNYTIITDSIATLTAGAWTGLVSVTATTFDDGTAKLEGGVLTDANLNGSSIANGEDLIVFLPFNQNNGNYVYDASPNEQDGTINGATWNTTGRFGSAMSFDGANDDVTIPTSAILNTTRPQKTYTAWINPAESGVFMDIAAQGWQNRLYIANNNHITTLEKIGGSDINMGCTAIPIENNTWTHVAMTYDENGGSNNYKLYVNGEFCISSTQVGYINYSTSDLTIGESSNNVDFNGSIDEFKLYTRTLTQAEIRSDMNDGLSVASPDGHLLERDIPYGVKLRFYNATGDIDGCMFHNSTDILLTSNVSLCT